jgi:RNA polymerase sigma-70 factor (ECF subfamily)
MKWSFSYKKYSDEELMSLIGNGNITYLKELYNRYSNKLLFYFYRMLGGDEEKAQDFLQDVFLKIIEKPDQFNEKMKFSTWIFTIASNLCKNEYRRMKVRETTRNEPDMDHHEQINTNDQIHKINHNDFEKAVQQELRKMDPEQRSTFILRFQENLSIKEIGEILNCSPGTVKSRIFYTTKKLDSRLKEYNPYTKEELSHG